MLLGSLAVHAEAPPDVTEDGQPGTPASVTSPAPAATESAPGAGGAGGDTEPVAAQTDTLVLTSGIEDHPVYKILVAEFAGRRGQLDLSLQNYLEVARESRDAKVAERAVRIALYARDLAGGVEASRLWSELDEESVDAAQIHAALLLRSDQAEQATEVLRSLVARLEKVAPGSGYQRVGEMLSREKNKLRAINVMRSLVAGAPGDLGANYALAELLGRSGELEEAAKILSALVEQAPTEARYPILYAQILRRQDNRPEAIAVMAQARERIPDSRTVRLTYARLLVDSNRFEEARVEFQYLVEQAPEDTEVRYALAVILMQLDDLDAAAVHLKALEYDADRRYAANYYLGQIAESNEAYEDALKHYGRVDRGEHRLNAQIRVAAVMAQLGFVDRARSHLQVLRTRNKSESVRLFRAEAELLARSERLEEAMTVYNTALTEHEQNGDLQYARAMLAEKLDQLDLLEQDLRDILSREPNNADALNALGYTLADRTDRFEEAYELIKRAHELKPDDHYIIDSLGWVMYRLGRYDEAVTHLRRAMELQPDPEIAAHLGEVLWVMGDKDAARAVWEEALQSTPGDEKLIKVKERFGL